jgi:hypothetical protein
MDRNIHSVFSDFVHGFLGFLTGWDSRMALFNQTEVGQKEVSLTNIEPAR